MDKPKEGEGVLHIEEK